MGFQEWCTRLAKGRVSLMRNFFMSYYFIELLLKYMFFCNGVECLFLVSLGLSFLEILRGLLVPLSLSLCGKIIRWK